MLMRWTTVDIYTWLLSLVELSDQWPQSIIIYIIGLGQMSKLD